VVRLATGHEGGVIALALSADGKRLVSRGLDRAILVWDAATGKQLGRLGGTNKHETAGPPGRPEGGLDTLTLSPDGSVLAVSYADLSKPLSVGVLLWDLNSGKDLLRIAEEHRAYGEEPWERPATFSPDGKSLARLLGNRIVVYDIHTGKELHSVTTELKEGFAEQIAFSPDGKRLALFTGFETAYLYDLASGKQIRRLGTEEPGRVHRNHEAEGRRIAFSPDGKVLAQVRSDNAIWLGDVETGKARPGPAGHAGAVVAAVPLDENVALTFGADSTVRRWRADTGKEIESGPIPGKPRPFAPSWADAFSVAPDGRTVAIQKEAGVSVWDTITGKELR
jgi:WD40 repeat protein